MKEEALTRQAFRVDYLIEDTLILEIKAGHQLPMGSKAQLLNYLRFSRKEVGLLLFFGPSPDIERVVLGDAPCATLYTDAAARPRVEGDAVIPAIASRRRHIQ
jgi:hypothetical protein